jgi:GT2 family glycosyltransferase
MPKFSIIIPVCGSAAVTRGCIASIKENSSDYEIVVIDNGSDPPWAGPEKIIRNPINFGFPRAVNQGVEAAAGEVIVVLNNDTLVTPHWLDYLGKHLKKFDIVGPCTNAISGPQQVSIESYSGRKDLNLFAEVYHKKNDGKILPWHRLVFFCVAIKKEVFDKIGLLDEQFSPGNFEDDDFCLRAIEAGFRLGIAEDVFIYHIGSVTHETLNIDFKKLMARNLAKFQEKWANKRYLELQAKCLNDGVSLISKNKPNLALVMIVKNEELGLERAILSVKDFCREIVIAVDNSSTDKTEEVAKKYATTLKHFDWHDDFSAARNFTHEGVKTDWILFLDGHEFVSAAPDLEKHLQSKADGLMCPIEMETGMVFGNPRIYRNGVQFEGKVHERQACRSTEPYSEFLIKHDRMGGQAPAAAQLRENQRNEQLPRILGAQFEKSKKNTRASFHLALHAQSQGDFRDAIRWWKRFLKYARDRGERWYAFFNLSLCHLSLGHFFRAFWAASRADDETPGRWEVSKIKGLIFFQRNKFQKAVECFIDSFKNNTGIVSYKPWVRDLTEIWNLIGECFYNLGFLDKAFLAFGRAAELCTDEKFKPFLEKRVKLMADIFKSQRKVENV